MSVCAFFELVYSSHVLYTYYTIRVYTDRASPTRRSTVVYALMMGKTPYYICTAA